MMTRAHLRAHNDYKFAHAPATAVVATYAKAQANISDGGGGGGGGASRARCARAQIDGIAPPERGQPTSPVAFNVSSITRHARVVQRARHEPRAPTVHVLSYSHMTLHMKMMFSRGLRPRLWKRVFAGPMAHAHMSGNVSSQHHKETPRCPLCNALASLTRLGSGVPRPPHMRIRPGSSFICTFLVPFEQRGI